MQSLRGSIRAARSKRAPDEPPSMRKQFEELRRFNKLPYCPQERSRRRRGRYGAGWRVVLWPG
jgi:hypothetical protein